MTRLVLGLDAGGSQTRAVLAALDSQAVIGRGTAGPGNPNSAGWEAAQVAWQAAIEACYGDAGGRSTPSVAAAWLGIAGCGRPEASQRAQLWLDAQGLAPICRVASDADNVLWTHPGGLGAALIAGTGAIAVGRDRPGPMHRIGGWGWQFGENGSGYRVAQQALQAVALAADRRTEPTLLTREALAYFGVSKPDELVQAVRCSSVARLAGFAAGVAQAAANNDGASVAILDRAAEGLLEMLAALLERLSMRPVPLAITGGLLLNVPRVQTKVHAGLEVMAIDTRVHRVTHPEYGAVAAARNLASDRGHL